VVRDPGAGFIPSTVPNPLAAENLQATHGRGIYLINQLTAEVSFERNGAEIRMRKAAATSTAPRVYYSATCLGNRLERSKNSNEVEVLR
jgi:anti-sigma regulatory factor (Ser/Thr protein kinase)